MIHVEMVMGDSKMNTELTEEWNQIERKESIMVIVLKGKTYKE